MGVTGQSPAVELVLDELVLDGVSPDDPLVAAALERAVGPALAERGLGEETGRVAGAVAAAVDEELGG